MSTEALNVSEEGTEKKKGLKGKKVAGDAAKFGAAAAAGVAGTMGFNAMAGEHPVVEENEEETAEDAANHENHNDAQHDEAHEDAVAVDPNSVRLDDDDAIDESSLDEISDNELHPLTGENDGSDDVAFIDIDDVDGGEISEIFDTDFADIDDTEIDVNYDTPDDDLMADTGMDMGDHDVLDDILNA